ncbi:MAG: diaminopimelate epimerase [Bacteroidetes bacterium]|nr:MAG: diaminopimelate epimerase [Bacteroidota bacterium]
MLPFHKYQGTGNDFILVDDREGRWGAQLDLPTIAWLCDRHFGIGADGLMLLQEAEGFDFRMVYFNADGRESTMCGNGGRCLVAFARSLGLERGPYHFVAIDGPHQAWWTPEGVRLRMSAPADLRQLSETDVWLDTGSPHLVRFGTQPVARLDVFGQGRALRYHPDFAARGGTNVNFVRALASDHLEVRTYERGVEAETLSCGTGVTACAYAYLRQQGQKSGLIRLDTPGGALQVQVLNGPEGEEVWLQGPATFVFAGQIDLQDRPVHLPIANPSI